MNIHRLDPLTPRTSTCRCHSSPQVFVHHRVHHDDEKTNVDFPPPYDSRSILDGKLSSFLFRFRVRFFSCSSSFTSRFELSQSVGGFSERTKKKSREKRLQKVVNQTFPISNFMLCLSHFTAAVSVLGARSCRSINFNLSTNWMNVLSAETAERRAERRRPEKRK